MRFEIEGNKIIDNKKEYSDIHEDSLTIEKVVCILNEIEMQALENKIAMKTLKHRIRELVK